MTSFTAVLIMSIVGWGIAFWLFFKLEYAWYKIERLQQVIFKLDPKHPLGRAYSND
jgi:hypothetical protein